MKAMEEYYPLNPITTTLLPLPLPPLPPRCCCRRLPLPPLPLLPLLPLLLLLPDYHLHLVNHLLRYLNVPLLQ